MVSKHFTHTPGYKKKKKSEVESAADSMDGGTEQEKKSL